MDITPFMAYKFVNNRGTLGVRSFLSQHLHDKLTRTYELGCISANAQKL